MGHRPAPAAGLEIEARCARGVPPAEARRQALAALGGFAATRDLVRASRFGAALAEGLLDVRYGLRLLRRSPGFAAAAVLTLTLAIGATTTIFSIVDAVLIQPPPFPDPERLVTLWQTDPKNDDRPAAVAPANFIDWRDRARSFVHLAGMEPWSFDFTGAGEPEVLYGSLVTEGFFEALGMGAAYGRTFLPHEFRADSPVVILTDGFWRRRFGGDAGIPGRSLVLGGEPRTVVGVLASGFELGLERADGDFYAPKAIAEWETFERGGGWWHVLGRLRPEVTPAEAEAEMDAVARRLAVDHPRTNTGVGARVIPLQARQVETVRPTLLLLWGAVVFVLLIACVNVANLMLARATQREQEFAIRAAVGGGPARLLRQLLTESVVIATLGGVGGLVVTAAAIESIPALMPADVPGLARIAVNGRLLGFSVGLVVATALLFGFAPARQVLRRNASDVLASGRRVGSVRAQQRLRRALVATEVALALVLLFGAGLLVQSFARLVNVDLGFAPQNAVALQVFVDSGTAPGARVSFYRETLRDIRALPGVVAAGAVSSFPLGLADLTMVRPLTLHDRPPPAPGEELSTVVSLATPGYIEAMQLPLTNGRWFDERDDAAAPRVAVVNEVLARRHWPETDPLARRLTVEVSGRAFEAEIVGVVGAARARGFDSLPRPEVFVPHAQGGDGGLTYDGGMTYVVRTAGNPAAGITAIQEAVWAADPLQTFYSVATVDQLLSDTLAARRFTTALLTLFGLAALALAGVGIYGVIAVATGQRTREIGLRLALGAQPRDMVRMVVGGAVGLAGAGVAAGLLTTLVASRALVSLLFEISPTDLTTLGGVSFVLLLVAAAAAYVPARRASRVDPLAALRIE